MGRLSQASQVCVVLLQVTRSCGAVQEAPVSDSSTADVLHTASHNISSSAFPPAPAAAAIPATSIKQRLPPLPDDEVTISPAESESAEDNVIPGRADLLRDDDIAVPEGRGDTAAATQTGVLSAGEVAQVKPAAATAAAADAAAAAASSSIASSTSTATIGHRLYRPSR